MVEEWELINKSNDMLTGLDKYYRELECEHRDWLSAFEAVEAKKWENVLANSKEAAMAEAATRRMLVKFGCDVVPNDTPDFKCSREGKKFYVEVTHIAIDKCAIQSGLPSDLMSGFSGFSPLTAAISSACGGEKPKQCAIQKNNPALVAIVTFHSTAALVCFEDNCIEMLHTGEPSIGWNVSPSNRENSQLTTNHTKFKSSIFAKFDGLNGLAFSRMSISGVLVCGLTYAPPIVRGLLHPFAKRPFDISILPEVRFCVAEYDTNKCLVQTRWERHGETHLPT